MHPFITFILSILLLFLTSHTVYSHPQPFPPKRPNHLRRGGNPRRHQWGHRLPRLPNPLPQNQNQKPQVPNQVQIQKQNQNQNKNLNQNLSPQNNRPGKFFGWAPRNGMSLSDNQNLMADEFLHAHNWVRKKYNLKPFTWDENLASFARKYLMQRYTDCKMVHSSGNYGENVFWGQKRNWTPSDAVFYWYMEKDSYDFRTRTCSPRSAPDAPKSCGHFTQIVWRDSVRLGCALQHCHNPSAGMLIACEYDPPGNYDNENPLEPNTPAR